MENIENNKKIRFASGYHFYKMFWVFFICSFLGYFVENIFYFVRHGDFANRVGLIYGPFIQIYGLSAVIMVLILHSTNVKKYINIFFASGFIGATFEFLSSFFQENIFGTISWDYSSHAFDFFGRTSLTYSFYWALLGVVLIKFIYPLISDLIEKMPNKFGSIITFLLITFMIFDILASSFAVHRAHERYQQIPASNYFEKKIDKYYPDSFMNLKYPNMIYL